MNCKKCGEPLLENETLCAKCGTDNHDERNDAENISAVPNVRSFSSKKNIVIIALAGVLALGIGGTAAAVGISNTPANRISRYMGAAERYLSEQNYEQAIIEFQRILEIDPMNADAYLGMAEAYIALGDIDNAIETLRTGLEQTDDDRIREKLNELLLAQALENGQTYLSEKKYQQAESEFSDALEIDEKCVEAYLGKAKAHYALGEIEKAVEVLQTGYEKTGDERILQLLTEYEAELLPPYETSEATFARIGGVSEGYIAAKNDTEGLWYFVDTEGNKLSETGYKTVEPFVGNGDNAYALATLDDDRFVLIDSKFQEVMDLSDKPYVRLFNNSDPLICCWNWGYGNFNEEEIVEIFKPDGTNVYLWHENEGISGGGISILDDPQTPDSIKNYTCECKEDSWNRKYHENLWIKEITCENYGGVYYSSDLDKVFINYIIDAKYDYDHTAEEAAWEERQKENWIAVGDGYVGTYVYYNPALHAPSFKQTYEVIYGNGTIEFKESPRVVVLNEHFTIDRGSPTPLWGLRLTLTKDGKETYSVTDNKSKGSRNTYINIVKDICDEDLFICSIKKINDEDEDKYALFKPKWYDSSDEANDKIDTEWEQISESFEYMSSFDEESGTFQVKKDSKWGYIDRVGKEIAMFDAASSFSGGYAVVVENGRGRVVNTDFEQIGEDFPCGLSVYAVDKGVFAVWHDGAYHILAVNS